LNQQKTYTGIMLAILATIVWSGNFIVARSVIHDISPVALSFYRWLTACLVLLPFCYKRIPALWQTALKHKGYFFWMSLTGVTLFNTFVYVAGHYSPAINLALIGTTSSPIFSIILARIFLKERISGLKLTGLLICIAGILLLLSKGSWDRLLRFQFTAGDIWILSGALFFAIYNIFVRKNPSDAKGMDLLFISFLLGTIMLLPVYLFQLGSATPVIFDWKMISIFLYLGAGASVIAFLCWNIAIRYLGAGKTALFGNLIPVFSTLEAVWLLGEKLEWIYLAGGSLVIGGLIIGNLRKN
jgi:drug/metabolite transporter (DMT)-like permease